MNAARTLEDLGEDRLVALLTGTWAKTLKKGMLGVGDDCAVLPPLSGKNTRTLFKTDAVVEGVHFTRKDPPRLVGWKALARCVSDMAAMGGEPVSALITLGAPPSESVSRLSGIYRGIKKAADAFGIALVGGETTRCRELFISVALTGKVEAKNLVLRSGASFGDAIFVTGTLGGTLRGKHLRFTPRLDEARWLVHHCKPSAMMDVSDGLAKDLPRLCRVSGVGFYLDGNAVPVSRCCSIEQALCDGEDFELLFTVSEKKVSALVRCWPFKTRLSKIGRITVAGQGKPMSNQHGFDHFKRA